MFILCVTLFAIEIPVFHMFFNMFHVIIGMHSCNFPNKINRLFFKMGEGFFSELQELNFQT